jgi:hypothetical protein
MSATTQTNAKKVTIMVKIISNSSGELSINAPKV